MVSWIIEREKERVTLGTCSLTEQNLCDCHKQTEIHLKMSHGGACMCVCVWRKDKMEREGDWFPCTMSRQAKSHYRAQLASEPDRDWCLFPVVLAIRAQTDDFSPSGSKRVKPAARETTCLRERERCTEYTTIVASCNWKCSFTTVKRCTDNIYKYIFCTWCYQGILM